MPRLTIGDFEYLLLLALVRLGDEAYGVTIAREVEARTGRSVSPGAVYTALDRLERRQFVESWLGDPTPQRGGRRKRHYRLAATGRLVLERRLALLADMARGLEIEPEVSS